MATYASNESAGLRDTRPSIVGNVALGGRIRAYRATIALDAPKINSTTAGTAILDADKVLLARVPAGMRFAGGRIVSSVSLGSATIQIGTLADPDKYRADATFTTVDAPVAFGVAAAFAAGPLAADEEVYLTVDTANLPTTAGAKLVIDLEFAGA